MCVCVLSVTLLYRYLGVCANCDFAIANPQLPPPPPISLSLGSIHRCSAVRLFLMHLESCHLQLKINRMLENEVRDREIGD